MPKNAHRRLTLSIEYPDSSFHSNLVAYGRKPPYNFLDNSDRSKAMNIPRTVIIGAFSAVANPVAAFIVHTAFENFSGSVQWLAVVMIGLSTGMLEGIFIGRPWHRTIGIGTFIGTLILWSPVVMATYGFALLALPLLATFAVLVWFGAKLGNNLRAKVSAVR